MNEKTLKRLQKFRAEAIPANAIRNQGAKHVLSEIRNYLRRIALGVFVVDEQTEFETRLDKATKHLRKRLPERAQHWGAARKALNLFLRDCTYDHHLRERYGLGKIEPWLEVPLDRYVALALRGEAEGTHLPRWDSLKRLDWRVSRDYQEVAQGVANRKGIRRVHLDLYYWRKEADE